jgi:hypothetical protein
LENNINLLQKEEKDINLKISHFNDEYFNKLNLEKENLLEKLNDLQNQYFKSIDRRFEDLDEVNLYIQNLVAE